MKMRPRWRIPVVLLVGAAVLLVGCDDSKEREAARAEAARHDAERHAEGWRQEASSARHDAEEERRQRAVVQRRAQLEVRQAEYQADQAARDRSGAILL